jgi:TP901 family phage tail tape measure protein
MAINVPLNAQLQNATQLQQQIQNAVNSVRINLGGPNGARALSSLSQPLGRLTGQADEFTKSLDAANARVLAFGASVGVVNAVTNAFKSLVNSTIEVEKAITAISVVGDQFAGKTKELSQGLFSIAKATGQSFDEVSKAALEFSRQGLGLEDTLQRTKDALILTRTTGLETIKSVEGLSAAISAFAREGLSASQVLNKLAAVDQSFKVSSADLIQAFERTGAAAQQAGVTFDELAGIVTALQADTSRGGAVIGNSLKTIFTRLQDIDKLQKLKNVGVVVEGLQGQILPVTQILKNLATDIQGFDKITQAGIFKDVAGTFQINQLISLLGDLAKKQSVSADATKKSAGATNEAYIANEKLNQSLDAILNKVATTGKQLGSLLGELGLTDNLKGLLDGINSFLEGANNLLQGDDIGSRFAKGFVKGIGAVLSGPGLGIFLAIIGKLSLDLAKFGAQSLKAFFGIGKAAADQKLVQESIVQTLLKNQSVLSSILNTQGGQNAQALKFLGLLNQQAAAMQSIQGLAGGIASTVYAGGYRATAGGLQRKAAGGYLPAQEASDVRRGVGGASPSSKVVAIPNFAFGGGKRGTMIANTSEYIVPNYAGGGSAIFNQDMVKTMGLPPGARKISAAGGFIPNFADATNPLDVSRKYALIVNKAISPRIGETISYKPKGGERVSYKANIYGIDVNKIKNNKAFEKYFSSQGLVKKYTDLAIKDAKNYSEAVVGQPISPVSINKLSNAGSIPSLVGSIFESGISAAIQDPQLIQAQLERSPNAPFDFVDVPKLNEFFGVPQGVRFIEAKYDASNDALNSFASKIFKNESGITDALKQRVQKLASGRRLEIRNDDDIKKLQTTLAQSGSFNFRVTGTRVSPNTIQAFKNAGGIQVNSSSGYIPNFASSALQQAIAREKSAGLSDSQIYVDQSAALKSPMNPMGLMVANRRDEPAGGFQGIARARKEGVNPKLYGAANGFVPNYVNYGAGTMQSGQGTAVPASLAISNNSANPAPAPDPKVTKSFADAAGKIFLLQSAVSFLTGAVGDSESSFAKLTQQVGSTIGNLTSLGLLGQQISQTNPAGNFGKFMKGLGLAGIGFAAVTEGFKLADFAIKEFSGENQRAALASAKLADASDKLSLKFESLSKTRQTELSTRASKILGSAGYEGFFNGISNIFRSEKLGGGDIGADPEVQKSIAQLLALGASAQQVQGVLESGRKFEEEKVYTAGFSAGNASQASYIRKTDVTQKSDILNSLQQAAEGGIGQKLSQQLSKFRNSLSSIDLSLPSGRGKAQTTAANIYGVKRFTDLNPEQKKLIKEEIEAQQNLNKSKQDEQKAQNAINFGERLSLEIAKQRLDRVFALKKINEESLTSQEQSLQYELETLDLSNKQKIIKESELKNLELERKKRLEILAATEEVVNKASQGGLSVNVGDLDKLTEFLKGNLGKIEGSQLSKQIQDTFKIGKDQADNLIKSLKEQTVSIEDSTQAQKDLNNEQTTFKLRIDNTNQSLQDQLSTFQRIAQTAQSVAGLNISFGNLDIGKNESEISRLQALSSNPNLTTDQKENIDKQVISLQKANNEIKKRNELESFQAKQAELSSQILKERASLEKTTDQTKKQEINNNIDALIRQTKETENNFNASKIAIDANTLSLTLQEQQIGKVIGAYASLNNQLLAFRRGAGERVAGAQLEALGATDINSLAKAGIKTDVEANASGIKDNAEYYKTIQEQTRLREIQFDLATAESEVRRRELQYELKYTQEIIDLKNKGATEQELIDARNRQILEQRSGRRGFEKGLDTIQERIDNYRSTLGEEIPNLFSSNLAQGLNDAISGAKSLKEALTDAATSFFQEITRKNISNLADLVTSGFGSFAKSGVQALGFASGGLIKGGSGTKDDVPAMLMGGEYVMKKSAVNKYGKGFLDALNNGKMRGYATGGLVDPQTFPTQTGRGGFFTPGDYGQGAITGKNELLTFATQSFTGGQYDYMGGFGMGGATIGLESESARLSSFGRENSPMFERVQQSKDEAFKVYLEGLQKEKEYAELLDQIAQNEKARKKQLQAAIISAVVSTALSAVGTRGKTGTKNSIAGAAASAGEAGLSFGQKLKAGTSGFFKGIFTSSGNKLTDAAKDYFKSKTLEKNFRNDGFYNPYPSSRSNTGSLALPNKLGSVSGIDYLLPRRASGGLISGGSNIRDDVPTMLTGGEFVLNNRATQRIGLQNLNKLNNGQSVSGEGASAEMTQALISKLDELIQATQNSSSENVVVNVSSNETGGQNQENPAGAEKELHKKIRQAVLDVIAQEKRLGGSLEKSR